MLLRKYADDIDRSWGRVRAAGSEKLLTPLGCIEYSHDGEGLPILMSHGIFGGHTEGIGMVETYVGRGFHAIAPSRFGYFDSTLLKGATPALQADQYVRLLDHLGVDRVVSFGYSAGSTSAIQLALRHPERVHALILASANLPGAALPPKLFHPLIGAALGWQLGLWIFMHAAPHSFRRLMGVPGGYRPTAQEQAVIEEIGRSMLPIEAKRRGAVFDTFTSNPSVNECPLEELRVPTLLMHAPDDSLAQYPYAVNAAERIPGARLATIERGGHLFLGHEGDARRHSTAFIQSALQREAVSG